MAHDKVHGADWLEDAVSDMQHAIDALLQMHRQWLESTASLGAEVPTLELLSQQTSGLLQQIYDAQLMWLAQDEWLKITCRWIDSVSKGKAVH